MYTEHLMQIVLFEESCVFTDVNDGSDGPGSSLFDIKPDRSDSQGEVAMYTEHEMSVVSFDNKEVFTWITPTASESDTHDYEEPKHDM